MTNIRVQQKIRPSTCISIGIWGCIAFTLILVHLRLFPYAEDDAYIHFRMALNLIDHGVPYFNIGEPVYATSSLCWTLLMSFIFKFITRDLYVIAILNSLLTAAGAFLYKRLLERLTSNSYPQIHYWFFVFLYIALVSAASTGLMETPFALLLLGIGLLLLLDKNPLGWVIFGCMVFTRLEYWVVFCLVTVYCLFQKTFSAKTILLWCALGVAPFVVFALAFWGTLIPNTMIAKQQVYSLSYFQAATYLVHSLLPDLSYHAWELKVDPVHKMIYVAALAILIMLFKFHKIHAGSHDHHKGIFYLLLASGVIIMGAYLGRRVLIFGWYVPLYVTLIAFGLYGIVSGDGIRTRRILIVAMIPWLVSVFGNFSQTLLSAALNDPSLYPNFSVGARVRKYIQLGENLRRQYPGATLLTSEIGGLGYGYAGYIYDGAGLVSPAATKFHPMKVPRERISGDLGAIPVDFVKLVHPDIIVGYDFFMKSFLDHELMDQYVRIREPVFLEDDLQRSRSKKIWGTSNLYVLIRKDLVRENRQ